MGAFTITRTSNFATYFNFKYKHIYIYIYIYIYILVGGPSLWEGGYKTLSKP